MARYVTRRGHFGETIARRNEQFVETIGFVSFLDLLAVECLKVGKQAHVSLVGQFFPQSDVFVSGNLPKWRERANATPNDPH